MNELALFAGAGGGILGGKLLGWNCVCAVEIEEYPRSVLIRRQRDGVLGKFPIWDDIRTFDGKPWRGKIDIITGGFPCQDISIAGKGTGIEGERSGLWGEMARVICEVRPRFALVENSPMLTSRGLGRVLGDLAEMGYDAKWAVLGADDVGAPHRRKRIWILAYTNSEMYGCVYRQNEILAAERPFNAQRNLISASREYARKDVASGKHPWWRIDPADVGNTEMSRQQSSLDRQREMQFGRAGSRNQRQQEYKSPTESRLGRVAHRVADRVERIKSIGNGQVPEVVVAAWNILTCNGI